MSNKDDKDTDEPYIFKARLQGKQEAFVRAYLGEARGNATQAARIAKYGHPDPSEGYLRVMGSENLSKPNIKAAIAEYRQHLSEKNPNFLSPSDIHALWYEIAMSDKEATGNRITALRDAARASGMFIERVEHKVDIVDPEVLDSIFGRVSKKTNNDDE